MYTLTVLCVFDPLCNMEPREMQLPVEYEESGHAELRALRWLMYRPNDIVMLVEPEACETCGPTSFELHPRIEGRLRCPNCKEHVNA